MYIEVKIFIASILKKLCEGGCRLPYMQSQRDKKAAAAINHIGRIFHHQQDWFPSINFFLRHKIPKIPAHVLQDSKLIFLSVPDNQPSRAVVNCVK